MGPPGTGKTHNMFAYTVKMVEKDDIVKLYILSPTAQNNENYYKDLDIEKEICDDMNESYGFIRKLQDEQKKSKDLWKEIHKQYPTLEKFLEFYKFIVKNEKIKSISVLRNAKFHQGQPETLDEIAKRFHNKDKMKDFDLIPHGAEIIDLCEKRKGPENYYNKPPLALLVCDDIQGTKLMSNAKTNPFINFIIKHRHYFCSVFFGVHTISNGLPLSIRAQVTDWMVFKVGDPKLIRKIHEEATGSEGDPQDFENFFKDMIDGEKNRFLTVNKKEKPIGGRFNWDIVYPGGLKQMLDDHKQLTTPQPEQTIDIPEAKSFSFTDGKNQTHDINLNLNSFLNNKKRKFDPGLRGEHFMDKFCPSE